MTDLSTLLVNDADGVRTLTLNRGARRNALDTALATTLLEALRAADATDSVGAVLLAANGPVFCAGADVGEFKGERADPIAQARRSETMLALQLAFDELKVPVVSAVAGAAVGAGASLAIAADMTVLAESARLSWPEVPHGMVPSLMLPHLQHRTTRKAAFELLTLGQPLDARAALALGLANRVVADNELLEAATQLARTLAALPRAALRDTKHLFASVAGLPLSDALRAARASARAREATPTIAPQVHA